MKDLIVLYRDENGEEREETIDPGYGETVADAAVREASKILDSEADYLIAIRYPDGEHIL